MITCDRCGSREHAKDVETLKYSTTFMSQPTTTIITLCKDCFKDFNEFLKKQAEGSRILGEKEVQS